jgi:hypothetical protein
MLAGDNVGEPGNMFDHAWPALDTKRLQRPLKGVGASLVGLKVLARGFAGGELGLQLLELDG